MNVLLTAWILFIPGASATGSTDADRAPDRFAVVAASGLLRAGPVRTDRFRADGRTSLDGTGDLLDEDDDTDEREDLARISLLGRELTQIVPVDPVGNLRASHTPPVFGVGRLFLVCQRFLC